MMQTPEEPSSSWTENPPVYVTRPRRFTLSAALTECNCLHGERWMGFGPETEMGQILAAGCPVHDLSIRRR